MAAPLCVVLRPHDELRLTKPTTPHSYSCGTIEQGSSHGKRNTPPLASIAKTGDGIEFIPYANAAAQQTQGMVSVHHAATCVCLMLNGQDKGHEEFIVPCGLLGSGGVESTGEMP